MAKTFKEIVHEVSEYALDKCAKTIHVTSNFIRNNPELSKDLAVIGAATAGYAIRNGVRARNRAKVDKANAHRNWYYDARSRCYYELTRPMNNAEKMILSRKLQKGYLAGDILASMGLIRL